MYYGRLEAHLCNNITARTVCIGSRKFRKIIVEMQHMYSWMCRRFRVNLTSQTWCATGCAILTIFDRKKKNNTNNIDAVLLKKFRRSSLCWKTMHIIIIGPYRESTSLSRRSRVAEFMSVIPTFDVSAIVQQSSGTTTIRPRQQIFISPRRQLWWKLKTYNTSFYYNINVDAIVCANAFKKKN